MRSLFATILAISASTSALPAIANSIKDVSVSSKSTNYLSTVAAGNIQNPASSQFAQRSLNLAKQIPIDVIGLVVVDLNPDSWNVVSKSQTVDPISALDQLLTFFSQSPQISIAKDIQPWLGKEMAIAFSANTEDELELTFTALSPVTDGQKFELFLTKLKSLDLPKPTETLYQNVKILEWQLEEESIGDKKPVLSQKKPAITLKSLLSNKQDNAPDPDDQEEDADSEEEPIVPSDPDFSLKRFAIAKLPSGVAVISTNRQAIQKIIDTSVETSELKVAPLANHPLFLRSLNNPLWNRSLIAGYGDFKGLGQISELVAADLPETSEIPGFSRAEYIEGLKYTLGQYSSFDLFTWVTPKGIRSQSNSYFSEVRSPLPKDTQTRDRLLSYLPSNLYGAITSRNLNRQWQWFVEESKMQPSYKIFVEGVRMLSSLFPLIAGDGLDLDIEKDIISWMDGEYAVVVFPSEHSPFKEIGVDLTIGALIRTSNPEAANATLAKLAKFFTGFTEMDENILQLKKRQVGATLLTSFEVPDNQVAGKTQSIFAYGWRDRQTLMLTLGANTASAFIPIPKPALAQSEMFRDAIADMPQPNFGYFYLNANAIAKQVATLGFLLFAPDSDIPPSQDKSSQPVIPAEIQKAIDRLGGAVFVYSETSDRFQSDFFLGVNP
ncbi:DUF3352 domain-containing protein [Phormidium tenue]|uniref:DUF3352 domain-containing protein n=1 Tax=Phormidium tenue FACHB-1050 TaxID=2692857 RepID=A0ABR8C561_9CYAN|nr:DUF3352 domain-containing protein [Phormidium tenue]MBD2315874.1 DUF3352 domain-containing protein [Phormidium tenue FACHB-1050]